MTDDYQYLRHQRLQTATWQQHQATNPQCCVWVEASAGTGKTKVLSDRVLRLLLDKVDPQRILCLTYTKAAAVEMNMRISQRLSQWAVCDEEKLIGEIRELLAEDAVIAENLKKYVIQARILFAQLLDTPGGMKIQTIHSFCQDVLKRFPLEAGISPYFEVMDDAGSAEVLEQIKKEILQTLETDENSDVAAALGYLTEHANEKAFLQIIADAVDKRSKFADILQKYQGLQNYLAALAKKLMIDVKVGENDLKTLFMQQIKQTDIQYFMQAWAQGGERDAKKLKIAENLINSNNYSTAYELYKTLFLKNDGQVLSKDFLVCAKMQKADENLLPLLQKKAYEVAAVEQKICNRRLYDSTAAVFTIANELNERYKEFKTTRAKLDYTDLILLTRELLADQSKAAWVLYKLDGGIDHILLDEAQDTSPEQWDIIKALSEEFFAGDGAGKQSRTVFAVGDRKQSIYSFQGADPQKFDIMSKYFSSKAEQRFKKVNLEVSFRSTPAILDTVNNIFSYEEVSTGVVAEQEIVQHIPVRVGEFGRVEIWPLLVAEKNDKVTDEEELLPPMEMEHKISVRTKLANAIAEKIKSLIQQSAASSRPYHFKDFMILVRRRDAFVEEFIRACKKIGVNISGADKLVLAKQIAVQDLVSLGKFLLLPNDDLSLAEVLKSPLFGIDDDDLLELCYGRRTALLWSKLGDCPKYAKIYAQLQGLLNKVDYERPYELYNSVLTQMDGRRHFVERMGIEVEDALDEFINLTLAYEREHVPSLQGFIDWMGHNNPEIKRETEQKDIDAVRLMTVHGSKGLQAPIVFLPDTVRVKVPKSEQNLLLADDMAYYPLNKAYYNENCRNIREINEKLDFEESRRLLYVALTRAEERLFICGYANSDKLNKNSWYHLCATALQNTGTDEGGSMVYETAAELTAAAKNPPEIIEAKAPAPQWLHLPVAQETPLAKPYTPSKDNDEEEVDSISPLQENGQFYRRGTLIHKLLQYLPLSDGNVQHSIQRFLQKNAVDFSDEEQRKICQEVLRLCNMPEFAVIFGEYSQAEVPIVGEIEGKIISAQIDRLVILPDKIIIVDFKTNRPPAADREHTPEVYVKQLQTYGKLLQKIYPQRAVYTYILWTNEARLMPV